LFLAKKGKIQEGWNLDTVPRKIIWWAMRKLSFPKGKFS